MAYRCVLLACLLLCLENVYSQAIVPNCGRQSCQSCCQPIQSCCQPIQSCCQPIQPCCQTVIQPAVVQPCYQTATIIQDDSIANDLTNALQLLIVTNLLSNTLPVNDVFSLGIPAIAQPGLCAQPAIPLATPVLQVAPVTLCGFGCGCGGCGCGGCGCGGCGCGGCGCGSCGCGSCGCGSDCGSGCGCGGSCGCSCAM